MCRLSRWLVLAIASSDWPSNSAWHQQQCASTKPPPACAGRRHWRYRPATPLISTASGSAAWSGRIRHVVVNTVAFTPVHDRVAAEPRVNADDDTRVQGCSLTRSQGYSLNARSPYGVCVRRIRCDDMAVLREWSGDLHDAERSSVRRAYRCRRCCGRTLHRPPRLLRQGPAGGGCRRSHRPRFPPWARRVG